MSSGAGRFIAVALVCLGVGCGYQAQDISDSLLNVSLTVTPNAVYLGDGLTATVSLQTMLGTPLTDATVSFSIDGNAVRVTDGTSCVSDDGGRCTLGLSAQYSGTATVSAEFHHGSDATSRVGTQKITVSSPPENITVTNASNAEAGVFVDFSGQVTTLTGTPVANEVVAVSAGSADGLLSGLPAFLMTDAGGNYDVKAASTLAGTFNLTAATTSAYAMTTVQITPGPPADGGIKVTASPDTLAADGHTTTTISVSVADRFGNAVPNAAVTFDSLGPGGALKPHVVVTGDRGNANATLRAIAPGDVYVQASSGGFDGNTFVTLSQPKSCAGKVVRYTNPPSLPVGMLPVAISHADFDQDGNTDITVINQNSNNITFYLGVGNGLFATGTNMVFNARPTALAVGNFNGDSFPDVAAASSFALFFGVALGTPGGGQRLFDAGHALANPPLALAMGPLNSDTLGDVAVLMSTGVQYWLGTTSSMTSVATLGSGLSNPTAMASGDINGDGLLDAVIVSSQASGYTAIMNEGGVPSDINPSATDSGAHIAVMLADLTSDGLLDLVMAPVVTGSTSPWFETAVGTGTNFFGGIQKHTIFFAPVAIAIDDMNNDGINDVVTTGPQSVTVSLALDTNTNYVTPRPYNLSDSPNSLVLTDVDGDDWLDIVAADAAINDVAIVSNSGGGFLKSPDTYSAAGFSNFGAAVADFNNDGSLDVAVVSYYGNLVQIYFGAPDGTFEAGPTTTFTSAVSQAVTGDINNDGTMDMLVVDQNGIKAAIGNGQGTFAVSQATPDTTLKYAGLADMNGDARLDIVAVSRSTRVAIALGGGQGTFSAAQTFTTGSYNPSTMAVADFNLDGKQDVVASVGNANVVLVYLGNGAGALSAFKTVAVASTLQRIRARDVDNDGDADLVSLSLNSPSTLAVVRGTGDGNFISPAYYPTLGNLSNNFHITDMDLDGYVDVLVSSDGTFTLFSGGADGAFSNARLYQTNSTTQFVYGADVNSDGVPDVISTAQYSLTAISDALVVHFASGCPD